MTSRLRLSTLRLPSWVGLLALAGATVSSACSSSDDGQGGSNETGGTSNSGETGGSMNQSAQPGPGEAPTIDDLSPGVDDEFQVPDFPVITGAGFGGTAFPSSTCDADCTDFPAEPLIEAGGGPAINSTDIAVFGAPDVFDAGNLCVVEPQLSNGNVPGALFPANWLRPRFRWEGGGAAGTLYEIRLANEIQANDLLVYTRQTEWTMPTDVWRNVARNVHTPITVTIRAASAGNVTGMRGTFQIAPVNAGGALVFWATTSSLVRRQPVTSQLLGFSVGDEGVLRTLDATDIELDGLVGEDGIEPRGTFDPEFAATGFQPGQVACVGCHISTPDGAGVVFTDNWPWNKLVSAITEDDTGATPDYMTDGASLILSQPWLGTQAMSAAHFAPGDRILVSSYGVAAAGTEARTPWDARQPARHALAWFDLEAEVTVASRSEVGEFASSNNYTDSFRYPAAVADLQQVPPNPPPAGQLDRRQLSLFRELTVQNAQGAFWDVMATNGETRSAVTPDWSNDGSQIAYVSTDITSSDGHPDWTANVADIKLVPYNDGNGGAATPLAGAAEPGFLEYYPAFSSDDALLAFARAPSPSNTARAGCTPATLGSCRTQNLGQNPDGPYYNRNGEIYVIPRAGGAPATRLAANDPVSCTGETARGSINSWPKWSPRVVSTEGKTYYFLVFSSARDYPGRFQLDTTSYTPPILPNSSQLYMTAIVVDAAGEITTYPAIYIWNQNNLVGANGNVQTLEASNLTPAWDEFILPPVVIQ